MFGRPSMRIWHVKSKFAGRMEPCSEDKNPRWCNQRYCPCVFCVQRRQKKGDPDPEVYFSDEPNLKIMLSWEEAREEIEHWKEEVEKSLPVAFEVSDDEPVAAGELTKTKRRRIREKNAKKAKAQAKLEQQVAAH